jgi:hypothetical protein
MNCIFCHKKSDNSKSVEHIVPESLGNKHTFLWRGAVCDSCNNYFAIKVEKELLGQAYFINLRSRNNIKTKKGRLVRQESLFLDNDKYVLENTTMETKKSGLEITFDENSKIFHSIAKGQQKQILIPFVPKPEPQNYILSRFLTKCAFEYLVFRIGQKNYMEFIKDTNGQFDYIRKYARYGEGCAFWEYSNRRIYEEDRIFIREGKEREVLNEMDVLTIEIERKGEYVVTEMYFVLAIRGIEYAINLTNNDISGYEKYLQKNNSASTVIDVKRGI